MREILFRGKRKDNGEWVESDSLLQMENHPQRNCHTVQLWVEFDGWVFVIPETIGQCTGLTDKNGKKIFDGDIVKTYLYEPKGLANYEIGCINSDDTKARFVFCIEEGNYGIDNSNVFEVIGNIHDNPELLKGGAE